MPAACLGRGGRRAVPWPAAPCAACGPSVSAARALSRRPSPPLPSACSEDAYGSFSADYQALMHDGEDIYEELTGFQSKPQVTQRSTKTTCKWATGNVPDYRVNRR